MADIYDLLSENDYFFVSIHDTQCINIDGRNFTFDGELFENVNKSDNGSPGDDSPGDDSPGDDSPGDDSPGDDSSNNGGPSPPPVNKFEKKKPLLAKAIKKIKSKKTTVSDEKASVILPLVLSLSN